MPTGKIIIISGPSGSGKTTLHNKLLQSERLKGKLVKSISATTRPPRTGEKNGKDYIFLSQRMFEHKIKSNQFLEWQRVFNNYYGTPKKKVKELLSQGHHVLLCIDVKGAKVVLKQFKDAIKIFIKTSSLDILKKRLESRALNNPEDLALRLKVAKEEVQESKHYDAVILNDDLEKAYKELETVVRKGIGEQEDN